MKPAVRFDWGLAGAQATGDPAGALVVVDVLSFSTAVTVATGRGTVVYPHVWPSDGVAAFAAAHHAQRAVGRREVTEQQPWSLSPSGLLRAPVAERLVLPSPNGSTIATAAPGQVVAGCLRNATAVARWLDRHRYGTAARPVTVIAAGERWPDEGLRPALEDLLGAAAIIAALPAKADRSPDAAAAEAVWRVHHARAAEFLADCPSGQELARMGHREEVPVAADLDAQDTVPVLSDGAFRAAGA